MASYRCELESLTGVANYDYVGSVHGQWGNTGRPLLPIPSYCTTMLMWMKRDIPDGASIDILTGAPPVGMENCRIGPAAKMPDIVLIHLGTVDLVNAHYTVASTVAGASAR